MKDLFNIVQVDDLYAVCCNGQVSFYTNKISNAILIREILNKDASNNIFSANDFRRYLIYEHLSS